MVQELHRRACALTEATSTAALRDLDAKLAEARAALATAEEDLRQVRSSATCAHCRVRSARGVAQYKLRAQAALKQATSGADKIDAGVHAAALARLEALGGTVAQLESRCSEADHARAALASELEEERARASAAGEEQRTSVSALHEAQATSARVLQDTQVGG